MLYMSKVLVNLRVEEDLLARIDEVAGPRQRTQWMVSVFEAALGGSGPEPEAPARELPEPEKPRKYSAAEMARKKSAYAKLGWVIESSEEMRWRCGLPLPGEGL